MHQTLLVVPLGNLQSISGQLTKVVSCGRGGGGVGGRKIVQSANSFYFSFNPEVDQQRCTATTLPTFGDWRGVRRSEGNTFHNVVPV